MKTDNHIKGSRPATEGNGQAHLLISGEVFISGSSLFGTEIVLYSNGSMEQKFVCCANGYFYFRLNYERDYSLVAMRNGCVSKTIVFSTHLHGHAARNRFYEFGITLCKRELGMPEHELYNPAAIIHFSSQKRAFEHDSEYAKTLLSSSNHYPKAA